MQRVSPHRAGSQTLTAMTAPNTPRLFTELFSDIRTVRPEQAASKRMAGLPVVVGFHPCLQLKMRKYTSTELGCRAKKATVSAWCTSSVPGQNDDPLGCLLLGDSLKSFSLLREDHSENKSLITGRHSKLPLLLARCVSVTHTSQYNGCLHYAAHTQPQKAELKPTWFPVKPIIG